jgi:AcrR family transcriptional regulator
MRVFWEHGFEGTSIGCLTAAMGVSSHTLYSIFGDKERLFLSAHERYAKTFGGAGERALASESSAHDAIRRWLTEAAHEFTRPAHPKGCMTVSAAMNRTTGSPTLRDALLRRRKSTSLQIESRVQRAIDVGEISADAHSIDVARFYMTLGGFKSQVQRA